MPVPCLANNNTDFLFRTKISIMSHIEHNHYSSIDHKIRNVRYDVYGGLDLKTRLNYNFRQSI